MRCGNKFKLIKNGKANSKFAPKQKFGAEKLFSLLLFYLRELCRKNVLPFKKKVMNLLNNVPIWRPLNVLVGNNTMKRLILTFFNSFFSLPLLKKTTEQSKVLMSVKVKMHDFIVLFATR